MEQSRLLCPHCEHDWIWRRRSPERRVAQCPICKRNLNPNKCLMTLYIITRKKVKVFHNSENECKITTKEHDHYSGI